jgi:hypothetical protein
MPTEKPLRESPAPGAQGSSEATSTPISLPPAPLERRKHLRFRVEQAIARILDEGLKARLKGLLGKRNFTLLNLSEAGARVAMASMLKPGALVHLKIEIESLREEIVTPAKIVWCLKNSRKEDEFHAGLLFTGLSPAEAKKITHMRDYLDSALYKTRHTTRIRERRPEPAK